MPSTGNRTGLIGRTTCCSCGALTVLVATLVNADVSIVIAVAVGAAGNEIAVIEGTLLSAVLIDVGITGALGNVGDCGGAGLLVAVIVHGCMVEGTASGVLLIVPIDADVSCAKDVSSLNR
jgi:hypothetical protein